MPGREIKERRAQVEEEISLNIVVQMLACGDLYLFACVTHHSSLPPSLPSPSSTPTPNRCVSRAGLITQMSAA